MYINNMNDTQKLAIEMRNQKHTLKEIEDVTGISKTSLSRLFHKHEITATSRHPCFDRQWLDDHKHLTNREKAKLANVPIATIHHWVRTINGVNKSSKPNAEPIQLILDEVWNNREWLHTQYEELKLGIPTIAKLVGCKNTKITTALRQYNIKLRSHSEAMDKFANRPTLEWLRDHYINKGMSIDKCAQLWGCGWGTMYEYIRYYELPDRSVSEQFTGSLNPFYGKEHDAATRQICADIGAINGSIYWTSGDVAAKVAECKARAKQIWADPIKRAEQSIRITELCKLGECNTKMIPYKKDGGYIYLNGTWELAIAELLDDLDTVQSWGYQEISIPYRYGGSIHNYVIDFRVTWNDGLITYFESKNQRLLGMEKEQAKIAAAQEYLKSMKSSLVVIGDKKDIAHIKGRSRIDPNWIVGNRYNISSSIVKQSPSILLEILKHDIVMQLVNNWGSLIYTDDELSEDLDRINNERLDLYMRSGVHVLSPGGSMAGRRIVTNFQKHFFDIISNGRKPIREAFNDPWVLYKSLSQSINEGEGLTLERLLREIWFHFQEYSRTSHFPPGFARHCIRQILPDPTGKTIFDPCCGWGGRLLGAYADKMNYIGCELSVPTFNGLINIANSIGYECNISNTDCLQYEWPECDVVFTSPPFYDIEEYIGDDQPSKLGTRELWIERFVRPFLSKLNNRNGIFYVDKATLDDFSAVRNPTSIINIATRRHPRRKSEYEYLAIYR